MSAGVESGADGAFWPKDRGGRWALWCSTYLASTVSRWRRPRMSIRSRYSRHKVPITRSLMALARAGPQVLMILAPSAANGIEASGEVDVAIADEELGRDRLIGEFHREVAGLLGRPSGDGTWRSPGDPDKAYFVMDDYGHVETSEDHRVDAEEAPLTSVLSFSRRGTPICLAPLCSR